MDVVVALAGTGDADRAEALSRSITDPARQARALAGVAVALAGAGDVDRAEALARSITDPALAGVGDLVACGSGPGDLDRAQAAGPVDHRPGSAGGGAGGLAVAAAAAGDLDRAQALAEQAEAAARSITDPGRAGVGA